MPTGSWARCCEQDVAGEGAAEPGARLLPGPALPETELGEARVAGSLKSGSESQAWDACQTWR